jgi:hypothetical protein
VVAEDLKVDKVEETEDRARMNVTKLLMSIA